MEAIKDIKVDHKSIEVSRNLYWNQKLSLLIKDLESREISIQRGGRQG